MMCGGVFCSASFCVSVRQISHYAIPPRGKNTVRYAAYQIGRIDLGAVLFSTSIISTTGYRFSLKANKDVWSLESLDTAKMQPAKKQTTQHHCNSFRCKDGLFFERLSSFLGPSRAIVVQETLLFHQ